MPPLLLLLLVAILPLAASHGHTTRRLLQTDPTISPAPPPPHRHHRHTPPATPSTPPQPPAPPLPPPPPPPHRHHRASPPPHQTPSPPAPPASPPPPNPNLAPPTPRFSSTSTTPVPTPVSEYPFTNYPFFPTFSPPPPPPPSTADQTQPSSSSGDGDASRTFPANISTLVAPNAGSGGGGSVSRSSRGFPVLQALLLAFLSLCLLLLSALLSLHLFRRLRRPSSSGHRRASDAANGAAASSSAATARRDDGDDEEEDGDEEGRRLKPPPMPTSSSNPSTEFLYLGTLATPPPGPAPHPRPGSPELRPLPPLPRVGPPSGEFGSRSSASDPSTVPRAAAGAAAGDASSSSLSPSSPSATSPTLGSSPVHIRPPSIPQPRGRAPNPSPPKRRPPPPPPPTQSWNPFMPVPPTQAAPHSDDDGDSSSTNAAAMFKSRPLHSDKLKPGSLHMKDEMIQLYLNNSAAAAAAREVCVLGAPRCHGIGVVLGALGFSEEQVRDALLEGNAHGLGVEALRMLAQLVLTNEEELKLRYFKDDPPAKLCSVDAFLKTILDVPFAFKRVDAMLYVSNFYLEVNQLRMSYTTLEAACQELRSSRLFHKVLGAVLNFGNMMSINTGSPNSNALEPNTLLKIVDVKGADGKAALLQFVVQEIMKPEGHNNLNPTCKTNASTSPPYDVDCRKHGLQVVSKLAAELTSTKKAASVDMTGLSRSVSELGVGLGKVHDVLRLNGMMASAESARRFHNAMSAFLRQAEEEIVRLQGQESVCLSSVREMAEYFHGGDSAGDEEARLFRVFAGVREFVAMLDRICREAGEVQGVGSTPVSWVAAGAPMGATP
ncbi:formin-like protein 14 [Hordeum vulgare]|nr:formin-like protein 14 [Hordeum vulgare]